MYDEQNGMTICEDDSCDNYDELYEGNCRGGETSEYVEYCYKRGFMNKAALRTGISQNRKNA